MRISLKNLYKFAKVPKLKKMFPRSYQDHDMKKNSPECCKVKRGYYYYYHYCQATGTGDGDEKWEWEMGKGTPSPI